MGVHAAGLLRGFDMSTPTKNLEEGRSKCSEFPPVFDLVASNIFGKRCRLSLVHFLKHGIILAQSSSKITVTTPRTIQTHNNPSLIVFKEPLI